ncbi:MAG: hypothetical protein Q7U47_03040 [Paludibacter sp.]|nr:hypothetical protein [Paludibacter sp.]
MKNSNLNGQYFENRIIANNFCRLIPYLLSTVSRLGYSFILTLRHFPKSFLIKNLIIIDHFFSNFGCNGKCGYGGVSKYILVLFILSGAIAASAQELAVNINRAPSLISAETAETTKDLKEMTFLTYDEVQVSVIVEGYGSFDVDVMYTNNDLLFVDIVSLFSSLAIPCVRNENNTIRSGFIYEQNIPYTINYLSNQIKVGNKIINGRRGIVEEMGVMFVESSLIDAAFGINLNFNYRSLTIKLKSNFELPIIKIRRLEKMRKNVQKIKNEIIADTIVKRNYHLFRFGTIDWSIGSSQTINELVNNQFRMGIGSELLFGEVDISLNYNDLYKYDNRQLHYLWRWVDNEKTLIKQAQLGRISNQTISFISSPIVGGVIRNTPTTVRKAKGFHIISEVTEPNWTVELYINDILVDFTKTDASGLYTFKVPIVYGTTTLKLKFYGPLGGERSEERSMNMPYTVMPTGEFEYGLSGGVLLDSTKSRFGRAEFNYGVNRFLTVGGGMEYLSSIPNGPYIPYFKATIRPFDKMTINAEYAHGVKTRGVLNFFLPKSTLLEIDYTKFVEGQLATRFNALEELKVRLSIPYRYKALNGFSKFDYTKFDYNAFDYKQANAMFSVYYKQFSGNSTTQINWIADRAPFVSTDMSMSFRIKNGYIFRPSMRYNVTDGEFMTYKAEVEKRIAKGYFSAVYERNLRYKDDYIGLRFSCDLNFARTNFSVSRSKGQISFYESAQGSLAFGGGNNYVHKNKNAAMGKGGIIFYPFLDLNRNGIFDKGEKMLLLTTVRVTGGRAEISQKDSLVRVSDLNAFVDYFVEFTDNDLENIAWRFKYKLYKVLVDPNQYKRVDVPVVAVGEASGMAYMNTNGKLKGIGRILLKIYKKSTNELVAQSISESNGYINYLGLVPGDYVARVDSAQLGNLDFVAEPQQIDFSIKTTEDGDMAEGLDFVLTKKEKIEKIDTEKSDTEGLEAVEPAENVKKSETKEQNSIPGITDKPFDKTVSNTYLNAGKEYRIQIRACYQCSLSIADMAKKYHISPEIKIKEDWHQKYYIYTIGSFQSYRKALTLCNAIRKENKILDTFVVVFKNGVRSK